MGANVLKLPDEHTRKAVYSLSCYILVTITTALVKLPIDPHDSSLKLGCKFDMLIRSSTDGERNTEDT